MKELRNFLLRGNVLDLAVAVVIGTSIFFVVKGANHLFQEKEAAAAPPPGPTAEETLLTEIRDLLKERA